MKTKIQKWGNSLAVRVPKRVIKQLGWEAGMDVVVDERENVIVIRLVSEDPLTGRELLRDLATFTGATRKGLPRDLSSRIDETLYGKPSTRSRHRRQ